MKISIGDIVELKKQHPCGGSSFTIMRVGMDFRIKCNKCNTQIWINRPDLEKRIKKIIQKDL